MSGLSGSQAAATLATTLVGAKLGLFDTTTINAVLVVILASLVVTPALVSVFGKRVPTAVEDEAILGKTVLVPVWGESSRGRCSPGGAAREQRRRDRRRGQLRQRGGVAARARNRSARSRRRRRSGWPRTASSPGRLFRVARTVPEGLLETDAGRRRDAAGHRVAHARADRARQRGVGGAGAHAGAGADRAWRRR